MTFNSAKKQALIKLSIGVAIILPALISSVVSLLKMLYFRMDDSTPLAAITVQPIKNLVSLIYQHTSLLLPFWNHSPTPDFMQLWARENIWFFSIYISIFVGAAFITSAKQVFKKLKKVIDQIEEQIMADSIKGNMKRSRKEIEDSIALPSSSIFSQAHQLYIAPIVTAIIGGLALKLFFGI